MGKPNSENIRPVYYNETDPQKCAWLRELISQNVIAHGEVDERSIADVRLDDLRGFSQCHFFAGIGVWSYALRLAGWPDDRPVWTGSCPCPSFSAAGKGAGFDDPRHRWPDWARLVSVGKPATIFGEQADDAIGYGWLDLVQTDLERENYAVGKAVLGACSVGAPHIRQRLYFVAHAETAEEIARSGQISTRAGTHYANRSGIGGDAGRMEHSYLERLGEAGHSGSWSGAGGESVSGDVADADRRGFAVRGIVEALPDGPQFCEQLRSLDHAAESGFQMWLGVHGTDERQGPGERRLINGFWRDADWILRKRWNRDDWEWCPTEPGTFPLAHGAANRVLKLRGYGDAICAPLAAEFIRAFLETQVSIPNAERRA